MKRPTYATIELAVIAGIIAAAIFLAATHPVPIVL